MRKFLPIAFFLVALPFVSFAKSGACSSHGGVSCVAGPDLDGSVICNDGWTNSSVSYASMVMCRSVEATPEPVEVHMPVPEPSKDEVSIPSQIPIQKVVPVVLPLKPAIVPEARTEIVNPAVTPVIPKPIKTKKEISIPVVKKENKTATSTPVVTTSSEVTQIVVASSTKPSFIKRVFRFFWK